MIRLFRRKARSFLAWDGFTDRLSVLELNQWQQRNRRDSLRNAQNEGGVF